MVISKIVKRVALCLLSAISLTAIFCLAALISAFSGDFNEYIVCCLAGILHAAIILLLGYKFINKIALSKKTYFIFTGLIPALLFNSVCVLYQNLNTDISVFDKEANIAYYLIFMSISSSVSLVAVAVTELITVLAKRKKST